MNKLHLQRSYLTCMPKPTNGGEKVGFRAADYIH
jgi:hypothetical protein